MSYELVAILMFLTMFVVLLTGRQIYAIIGGVSSIFALILWGKGGVSMPFHASFTLMNWYPLVTLPIFIYIGYLFHFFLFFSNISFSSSHEMTSN